MPRKYEYPIPHVWDGAFIRAIISRDVAPVLGITETPKKLMIFFDSGLTVAQKSKLDQIIANPPEPVRYEYGAIDVEEFVETEVGVKPARVSMDEARNRVTIDFEKPLTPADEAKLKTILAQLRRLKRRR